jgi:hypothetical protein
MSDKISFLLSLSSSSSLQLLLPSLSSLSDGVRHNYCSYLCCCCRHHCCCHHCHCLLIVVVDSPWCEYHCLNIMLTEIDGYFMCYYLSHNNPPHITPWNHCFPLHYIFRMFHQLEKNGMPL